MTLSIDCVMKCTNLNLWTVRCLNARTEMEDMMRKIKRSQNRHRNRMLASMASVALAITMMVNGAGIGIQPVLAAEAETVSSSDAEAQEVPKEDSTSENEVNDQPSGEDAEKKSEEKDNKSTSKNKEIYLNGTAGSNSNDGTSPDNAVKTFTKAKKLAGKSGTIYVTGSITIHSSANWSLSGAKIKKAKGFNGPIVIVKPGAVLTLSTRFISEKDMELASSDCLVIKSEAKKEETKGESSDSADNKTDNKKEETTETGKTEEKKQENKDETSKEPAGDSSKEEDKTSDTKKKKAKDITTPSLLIMEKQQSLSNLPLTNCEGDGIFYWADGSYVPDKYEDTCTIIFKPEDTKNYDYSDLSGWNEKRQIIKRKVKVRVESLKDADKKPEDSKEDTEDKDTGKGQTDSTQSGNSSNMQTGKDTADNTVSSNSQGSVSGNTQGITDKENTNKDDPKGQESTSDNTQQNTDKDSNTNGQQNPEKDTNTNSQPNAGQEVTKPENEAQEDGTEKNEAQVSDQDKTAAGDIVSMIQKLPHSAVSRADVQEIILAAKAYESLSPAQKSLIEAKDTSKLLAAQESCKRVLLTSNGVSVSGDFLPWYVEFRASFKPSAAYEKEQNIRTILSSYELKLWNLLTDTEYKIPEGEKVKVKMKAPDTSLFDQCVIIHTLEDGSKEYITPIIEGEWLTFETRSFSPFDVAGSKVLAGALVGNNTTDNPPSLGSNPISSSSDSSKDSSKSNNTSNSSSTSKNSSSSSSSKSTSSNDKKTTSKSSTKSTASKSSTSSSSKKTSNPQTGDTLVFLPYLFSAAGAMAVILFLYFSRRRVKK